MMGDLVTGFSLGVLASVASALAMEDDAASARKVISHARRFVRIDGREQHGEQWESIVEQHISNRRPKLALVHAVALWAFGSHVVPEGYVRHALARAADFVDRNFEDRIWPSYFHAGFVVFLAALFEPTIFIPAITPLAFVYAALWCVAMMHRAVCYPDVPGPYPVLWFMRKPAAFVAMDQASSSSTL